MVHFIVDLAPDNTLPLSEQNPYQNRYMYTYSSIFGDKSVTFLHCIVIVKLIITFLPLTWLLIPLTEKLVTSGKIYCIIMPVLKDEQERGCDYEDQVGIRRNNRLSMYRSDFLSSIITAVCL